MPSAHSCTRLVLLTGSSCNDKCLMAMNLNIRCYQASIGLGKKSTILGICTTNPTILFQEQALGSPLAVWSQWCIRGKCCAHNVATSTWCHKLSHKHCSEKAWQASPKDPTACPMVAVNAPLSAKYGNILAYCLQLFTRLGSVEQNKYLSRQD